MNINPKRVVFDSSGTIQSNFWIKNDESTGNKVLVFKVRRSEQKVVDFTPKYGRLEPGQRIPVRIDWLSQDEELAKVAIKAMSVEPQDSHGKFDVVWDNCASKYEVMKEVIDIFHSEEMKDSDDPYEETFDEGEIDKAISAKTQTAPAACKATSPKLPIETQKLFSELTAIDESVERQYKTDPETLTPRRIKKSIVSPTPTKASSETVTPALVLSVSSPDKKLDKEDALQREHISEQDWSAFNAKGKQAFLEKMRKEGKLSPGKSVHKMVVAELDALHQEYLSIQEGKSDKTTLLGTVPQEEASMQWYPRTNSGNDSVAIKQPGDSSPAVDSAAPKQSYISGLFGEQRESPPVRVAVDASPSNIEEVDEASYDVVSEQGSPETETKSISPTMSTSQRQVPVRRHPKELDTQFLRRRLSLGCSMFESIDDSFLSKNQADISFQSTAPRSSPIPKPFESDRYVFTSSHTKSDVFYQQDKFQQHIDKLSNNASERRLRSSEKKQPLKFETLEELKNELREDLSIITKFDVRLLRIDGEIRLESLGASSSILSVIEAFCNATKAVDRCSESVSSVVVRDNSGPISLPVLATSLSNYEIKFVKDGEEKSAYLGDDIKELIITRTMLPRITKHICLLKNLTKLDLSNNCIQEITDQIELPLLEELNLSSNHLKSLDFLQTLSKLKTLDASNNSLHTLHTSVHMLVPQSATLLSIDLSGNPVCDDLGYCGEVVSIFPKLIRFDGRLLYDIFVQSWKIHSSLSTSFSINDSKSWDSASVIGNDDSLKFEVRLRRALKHKFRGMSREQIQISLGHSEYSSGDFCSTDLDKFLTDALKIDPNQLSCVVPVKKPLEEVASYMKTTNVSKSKRQSFLVNSHSWNAFKQLYADIPDEEVKQVGKAKNRIFEKTASARTKRMSFLSMEAINALELKCAQTPDKKPLSRGTLKYKEFTACAKQKRKSFIDVNKELCSKVPLRVSSPAPVPAYMKPTDASKPKRMSFYQAKPEFEGVINKSKRKSFIEINVEKCCTSPKIEAIQRKLTRPPSPSAAYVTKKTVSRRLSIETNNSSRRSSLRSASAPSGSTRKVNFSEESENGGVPSLCKVNHRPMFYIPPISAPVDSPKVDRHVSASFLSEKANSITFESNYFVAQGFKAGVLGISYLRHGSRLNSDDAITVKIIPKSGNITRLASIVRAEVIAEKAITAHLNIIKLYDFFDRPKDYYLVYECVLGGDLFDYVATKQRFTEQDARSIVNDMCNALEHIHSKGIVHLDIRPENFLITTKSSSGTVKLTGFTSSKKLTDPVSEGYIFGAFEFMSINRLIGANYDTTDDTYSVGVLLHVLLCGYLPFFETGREAQHVRLKRGSYEFDSSYCKGLSDLSKNLINKLLSSYDRPTASAALRHAWFSEYPEKLLEFEWTSRNMKLFRRYNARRKILSIAREVNFRKRPGRCAPVASAAPKQSYMSGLFGVQRDSPPATPAMVAVVEQMKERPLHPRESAMKPSQASPKPGLVSAVSNLFGKTKGYVKDEELFADLSD